MSKYLELGYMKKVSNPQVKFENSFYLPHYSVFKNDGFKKIHVVFNASQKTAQGVSLNFFMHTGPKLQEYVLIVPT